jgi:hypothetical protein
MRCWRQRLKAFWRVGVRMDQFCFPGLLHAESLAQVDGRASWIKMRVAEWRAE